MIWSSSGSMRILWASRRTWSFQSLVSLAPLLAFVLRNLVQVSMSHPNKSFQLCVFPCDVWCLLRMINECAGFLFVSATKKKFSVEPTPMAPMAFNRVDKKRSQHRSNCTKRKLRRSWAPRVIFVHCTHKSWREFCQQMTQEDQRLDGRQTTWRFCRLSASTRRRRNTSVVPTTMVWFLSFVQHSNRWLYHWWS